MSFGERAALEGLLGAVRPDLAIEIGRAEGGSLQRVAAHLRRVISFDLVDPPPAIDALANVEAHVGDSHRQLPETLAALAGGGERVDFVLVDGDHSAEGVRQDIEDLLASESISHTVIVAHDSLNEAVRNGLTAVDYESVSKVAWVEIDFVPGYVAAFRELYAQPWGGFALIVVDESGEFRGDGPLTNVSLVDQADLVWPTAAVARRRGYQGSWTPPRLVEDSELAGSRRHLADLEAELERQRSVLRAMQQSASWRMTEPLRSAKRGVLRLRARR
jgi:hypothetical protein